MLLLFYADAIPLLHIQNQNIFLDMSENSDKAQHIFWSLFINICVCDESDDNEFNNCSF